MAQIKMPPARVRTTEMMITKFKFKKSISAAKHRIYYIGERDHTGYANEDEQYFDGFDDNADRKKLLHYIEHSKIAHNPHLASFYDVVLSVPKELYENPQQFKDAVRSAMKMMEQEKGMKLHWLGGVHDPMNEKGTQPHVHLAVASEGEYRQVQKSGKKTGYVKFSKEDIAKLTNHVKKEMGMDYVTPEHALENENRIRQEWKTQSLERKIAWEFGLAEQRILNRNREFTKTPMDIIRKFTGGADNTPTNRSVGRATPSSSKGKGQGDEGRTL